MESKIEFKLIPSFPNYEISLCGTIRSRKTGRILKVQDSNGYKLIGLSLGGKVKTVYIHRVLAQLYVPNPENKPEVNHINGIKSDNSISNLEWCSSLENKIHAIKTGLRDKRASTLTAEDILEIRRLIVAGIPYREIGSKFGITQGRVSAINRWKRWRGRDLRFKSPDSLPSS